jgi:hypothetical protein
VFVASALLLLAGVRAIPQTAPAPRAGFVPRLEAVAETKLLMEGVAHSNLRGLEGLLKQRPADLDAWVFARGQALLIAETGNLLLLRPPRNEGRDTWQMRATDLRESATSLARLLAARDYERSRAALVGLAGVCNRCHQTFQVPVRLNPFANPAERAISNP